MGGMAAQIPIKDDPAANERGAGQGARRQAARGRRTATTAPGSRTRAWCRSRARSSTRTCRARTSSTRQRDDVQVTAARPARGARRARAPRRACATTSASACSTSRPGCAGIGCVPLYNLMEDAATAEISRAQVWQWIRHGAHARRRPSRHRRALSRAVARRGAGRVRASVGASGSPTARFAEARARCSSSCPPPTTLRGVPDAARLRAL